MYARTGSTEVSPDRLDEVVSTFEREQIPRYREREGYKGFTLLVNRRSGRVTGVSFWRSEEARQASEELGAEARESIRQSGDGQAEIVREDWEVALDDMV
jgi:heme-degrading monooxygenase HmoA